MDSLIELDRLNIPYTLHNQAQHVRFASIGLDYWPSTGKWIHGAIVGKGLDSLIAHLTPKQVAEDDSYMQSLIDDYEREKNGRL